MALLHWFGLLDMWRIDIIEKIWPLMYCFIDINLFFVTSYLGG